MDLSLYLKVVDEIASFDPAVRDKEIELFHFGESLLHPDLVEMVAGGAERGLNLVLSVNPPHMEPNLATGLLRAGLGTLILSLDGHDAESYRALRGPAADLATAERNLAALAEVAAGLEHRTRIVVRLIEMNATAARLPEARARWEEAGFEVTTRRMFPWTLPAFTRLGPYERLYPHSPCPYPWQYLVVQWDGTVVTCCRDHDARNAMGNVRDQSLEEIWNGPAYARLRAQAAESAWPDFPLCAACEPLYRPEPDGGIGE